MCNYLAKSTAPWQGAGSVDEIKDFQRGTQVLFSHTRRSAKGDADA